MRIQTLDEAEILARAKVVKRHGRRATPKNLTSIVQGTESFIHTTYRQCASSNGQGTSQQFEQGGLAAAIAGLLVAIPSYKTRGDYLAIITIAANYIIISLIENLGVIGGSRGFMGMKKVVNAMGDTIDLPWMVIWVFIFTVATVWILRRYNSSTFGKGVSAICQDEVAAEIMSVDTNKVKTITFMLSSGLAGVAGGLFAYIIGYVNPGSFNILKSTEVLVMVYLGGMASLSGAVMSAMFFTILLELLRPLQIIKWVVIPLLLIIVMQFRPEGIMGNRELSDIFPKLKRFYRFK